MAHTQTERAVPPIVVGVDGSAHSDAAADWAAHEADERNLPLHIVYGLHVPDMASALRPFPLSDEPGGPKAAANELLSATAERCRRIAPATRIDTQLGLGDPVRLLLRESRTADLVVMGSRGLGGFLGAQLGSVSTVVAAHAASPTVVVRGRRPEDGSRWSGPVVAGVDGSDGDDLILDAAFDAAERACASLVVVYAWSDTALVGPVGLGLDLPGVWAGLEAQGREVVAGIVARWAPKYPNVMVEPRIVRDRPAQALLDLSHAASLVVVGSRGRGGLPGLPLGSVARALIGYAFCPVSVQRIRR